MNLFTAQVRDLSHKGLGVIDHPDGRVLFARGVWPGDVGVFSIAEDAEKYSEAQLHELQSSSPARTTIPCPHRGTHAGQCGGCPWIIADYSSQLEFKVKRLRHALDKRKVSYVNSVFQEIIPSPEILGYRNRVQLKTDGVHLGYVSEGTRVLAPVEDCQILNPVLRALFHEVRKTLPRADFQPGEGHHWNFLDLDDEMTIHELKLNKRRPFRQGNSAQNSVMRNWVAQRLSDIPRHWPVIDLFSGSGNFTEVMSEMKFENILAAEVQGAAVAQLEEKKLPGVRVFAADLMEKGAWARVARLQPHAKALLLDPPREGLDRRRGFFKYFDNLQYILYISCELDSFARDAADFISHGFELAELTPIDLFPHTPHVEIMSVFKRRS